MRREAAVAVAVAAVACERLPSDNPDLNGAGPVRYGMTQKQAMRALDRHNVPHDTARGDCGYLTARVAGHELAFMVEDGIVVRVDVRSESTMTDAGARVGLTEDSVQALYLGRLRITPHKYVDGHYLTYVAPRDTMRRVVFETEGGRVTAWRSGLYPAVEYVEGCS